jgi:hypothetical protein
MEQEQLESCLTEDQSGRESDGLDDAVEDPRFIPLSEEEATQALRSTDSTILPEEPVAAGEALDAAVRLDPPPIARVLQGRAASARNRAGSDIRAIVMHTPEGGVSATLGVLKGTRASFDFYLPLNGELHRCNDYRRFIAFQAGHWPTNESSVGIEQGDFAANSGNFPDEHYRRLAYLVAYLIQNTATPLRYAQARGEDGIIDHRTVTPDDRIDPGKNFKRQRLLELVQGFLNGTEPSPWTTSDGITWVRGTFTAGPGAVARTDPRRGDNVIRNLTAGETFVTDGFTDSGQDVAGSSRWFHLALSAGHGWVHSTGGTVVEG